MADQTNPYAMMGMANMMMPNPYTQYKGALPMPGFMGTPTDAQGNPIQSYLNAQAQNAAAPPSASSTTLNSIPNSQWAFNNQMLNNQGANVTGPGQDLGNIVDMRARNNAMYGVNPQGGMVASSGAGVPGNVGTPSSGGSGAGSPVDMRQAYLTALSNPGPVTTPGATVPQSAPLGQPSVLDAFLSTHSGSGPVSSAPGAYNNSKFFDTLNKLKGS